MAASVAHELRNPLNIIDATGDLINRKYGRNNDEIFEFIPNEVQRLGRIIDDFLTFARGITPRPEELELSLLIKKIRLGFPENKSSALLFENRMSRNSIQTDPDILEQILLNIIRNGMEAISETGMVNVVFESGPGEKMKILVADNGRGIDPVQRERIFEPFYTTKQQGTGLGLAITKRLIESLNGTIQINSQPGQGTRVEIYLPLS
jgi:signal transduction histidine kinase